MKTCLTVFVLFLSDCLLAQQKFDLKMGKTIIDSSLTNELFNISKHVTQFSGGTTIIEDKTSGKKDTIVTPQQERDIVINCNIIDSGRRHIGFDNCVSFLEKDTMVIQFQNNSPYYWDRLLIHIIIDRFYAEYVWTNKSVYNLIEKEQILILKKIATKRGQRLLGELTIHFINQNTHPFVKTVTFT